MSSWQPRSTLLIRRPPIISAPPKVPQRVVCASRTSSVFNAQLDSSMMVAPFSMVTMPNAESSTVNFSGSQSPQALPVAVCLPNFLYAVPSTAFGLIVVHHPQGEVERVGADIDKGSAALFVGTARRRIAWALLK